MVVSEGPCLLLDKRPFGSSSLLVLGVHACFMVISCRMTVTASRELDPVTRVHSWETVPLKVESAAVDGVLLWTNAVHMRNDVQPKWTNWKTLAARDVSLSADTDKQLADDNDTSANLNAGQVVRSLEVKIAWITGEWSVYLDEAAGANAYICFGTDINVVRCDFTSFALY